MVEHLYKLSLHFLWDELKSSPGKMLLSYYICHNEEVRFIIILGMSQNLAKGDFAKFTVKT